MKGLIKEGTRPYCWQSAIPARCRGAFDGKKKFVVSLKTHDHDEALRLATLARREFEEKCGTATSPIQVDIATVAGLVFEFVMHRPDGMAIPEATQLGLISRQNAQHPLVKDFPSKGPTYDSMAEIVEKLWRASAMQLPNLKHQVNKKSLTLDEQAEAWKKTKPPLTAKTIDQYIHDTREFSRWFEGSRNDLAIGAVIDRKDVNDYIRHRMQVNESKATIMRRLSSLKKVYKSGQFSDDNPFAGVTDRIDIHGPELEVRNFADDEVRHLFKEMVEFDINVQWATRIGLYTGMRLAEMTSLHMDDIKSVPNGKEKIFYIDFRKRKGRRVKTTSSYRCIPLHPAIKDELLEWIRGRNDPAAFIFEESEENKYKSRSAALSKRLARLIDRVNPDPEVREHSFRHTVISKLAEAGVREELRKALVGHAGGDAHDGYNHAMRIKELFEAISLLSYD